MHCGEYSTLYTIDNQAGNNQKRRSQEITPLKDRYADMIKRRLSGNLGICEQCVLECSLKR